MLDALCLMTQHHATGNLKLQIATTLHTIVSLTLSASHVTNKLNTYQRAFPIEMLQL